MSDEQPTVSRRRTRGVTDKPRSAALEHILAKKRGYEIKVDEPIYDKLDEEQYEAYVAKRKLESEGFIVDDGGLGYCDEGQEVDWSIAGSISSEDELDEGLDKSKRKKSRIGVEKKEKKPVVPLLADSKQRISNLFTKSVFRKDLSRSVDSGSIVDDVLKECVIDDEDRERRKRLSGAMRGCSGLGAVVKRNLPVVRVVEKPVVVSSVFEVRNEKTESNVGKIDVKDETSSELVDMNLGDGDNGTETMNEETETKDESNEVKVESKEEIVVKEVEKVFAFNAKVEERKETGFSATAGWQEVRNLGQNAVVDGDGVETVKSSGAEEKLDFEVDDDGSLPFYILDAYEEYGEKAVGDVYLFGKVKSGATYKSCCAVVKNSQRCVYAFPTVSYMLNETVIELEKKVEESRKALMAFKDSTAKQGRYGTKSSAEVKDSIAKLEKDVEKSQAALRTYLHELAYDLKAEIANKLMEFNISSFSMTPVKRNYAFERTDIPHGENYTLKINYPFKNKALPSDLKGNNFCGLLGTSTSCLELLLIKRKIKGPSWLSIRKFSNCESNRVSWCKFEVIVDCPKNIQVSTSSKYTSENPPVVVTAINLKTIINDKQNVNEIVSAHVISCHKAKIDTPMLGSEWTRRGMLSHFTVVRKLDGGIYPMGFVKEITDKNTKAGSIVICHESSERALLNRLMVELYKLDSDVLVGHNISGFDLDILLHRVQACKVGTWSKIGRLKWSIMPKLNKGSSVFGSGASPGIMSCIAGRLLCDTFICARDLLKEVSYSLTQLAKTQLKKERKEITPHDIPRLFQSSESLMELIECGETDAWLAMELMFHLSILPLTRQLTNISGNLWHKTLQGARAQRVEYLLLHAFHAKKFVLPDRLSFQSKDIKTGAKRKMNKGAEGKDAVVDNTNIDDDEPQENDKVKPKKGPSYAGGLVLEPKKGLYDKYVLLLDFNSLYPSIIQEYNICFTTVERSGDESGPCLPSSKKTGVLPELLKNLVERRRMVKSWLKKASGLKFQQFDIQQQALKLTANSMYGCLGFSNSRFYAKPLAELITLQGREILQSTVDLVQNTLNLEVIYGDTDSIMIYSGLDDIGKAKMMAGKVIQEVNKKYRTLEIDLDGLYKRMLLLKKKKYAAVKMDSKDGEVIERKGLDMVRRDWSLISKELGDFCLGQLLSGGSCEDVVEKIHNSLMEVQEKMRKGEIPLEKYVITKTLTKPPEAYPDSKSQPHVEVALRLKRNGYVTGCSAGDTVPYIICCEQGNGSTNSVGIAQRARHPDELRKDNASWMVDIDYYLAQQIHPVISRLCASIQGTSPARLADCLGLDSSKFQNKIDSVRDDPSSSLLFTLDDDQRYRGCEPLVLSCPSCLGSFELSPILSSVCKLIKQGDAPAGPDNSFWQKLRCPKCPEEGDKGEITPALITNQLKRQVERFTSTYYKGLMMCDDETCNCTTRSVNLRVLGDAERGTTCPNYPSCNGHLYRKYTEADLYKQLSYFCYILDTVRGIEKVEGGEKVLVEKEVARIRPLVDMAESSVQKIRDQCAYGWVKLTDLVVMF